MRRQLLLLLIPAIMLVPEACRQQPEGAMSTVVIGGEPKVRDPALGPLPPEDALLLQNVAQGLVRFDASGNIVGGLAERWNVSDDGLSYIFRLTSARWPDGNKVTATQVAKLLKRQLAERSRNSMKDSLGAVEDVIAMTDRVIEIQLVAPRPNLLSLLAQPELSILRDRDGTGPFTMKPSTRAGRELRLEREVEGSDEDEKQKEEVLLSGASAADAIAEFANDKADLVLGGTFIDLPLAQRAKLPRGTLRFDPASGLFGLVPTRTGKSFDNPKLRYVLGQAIDRANYVGTLGVPGLAARATLLEPGLDGLPTPAVPAWFGTPLSDRLSTLKAQLQKQLGKTKPVIRLALPEGPGSDILFRELQRDWGAIGLSVERAPNGATADFVLIDEVAPSSSPAWFVRRFRCDAVAVCDAKADELMDAARETPVAAQRYALLAQAAGLIDEGQLFIPIAAPVRWSLVSARVQGFAGNRYARHTLTDLGQQPGKD
ncbi:MAG: ABC transporter substrate-binding protein [Sphingomonas sp.]|nr:ABC transporter substrate-binding protein [Sphingomonas sp.]